MMTSKDPSADKKEERPPEEQPFQTGLLSGKKHPPARPREARGTGMLGAPWRLLIQIGHLNQTTVGIEVHGEITIGRADPSQAFEPDLDLTPYGGRDHGVSRRHAVIRQRDQQLFLQDLGSANGTRLNGGELEPGAEYRLRDGDQVDVGEIRLSIRFIQTPH